MSDLKCPEPRQCLYWQEPERVHDSLMERFALIRPYADESHFRRYLLQCRECGQLYVLEFYEWIDGEGGNDPQYTKYIPVSEESEAERLAQLDPAALRPVGPALCIDFPENRFPTLDFLAPAS